MFRFFKSTGISSQRTVAAKATVCFPESVRSLVYINFVCRKHIWCYSNEYHLHIENNLVADLYAEDA